jgi:hypothetical protein
MSEIEIKKWIQFLGMANSRTKLLNTVATSHMFLI